MPYKRVGADRVVEVLLCACLPFWLGEQLSCLMPSFYLIILAFLVDCLTHNSDNTRGILNPFPRTLLLLPVDRPDPKAE